MKTIQSIATATVLMIAASNTAWADRGHYHGGHGRIHSRVFIGVGPFWDPWYYGPPRPYYYPPPVVYTSPPVYIEQLPTQETSEDLEAGYWYYCAPSKGYYPYVKQCPSGWQQVAPTPPDAR